MGWIAKPGSAEDKIDKWLDRTSLTRLLLCFSAILSLIIAVGVYRPESSSSRALVALPILYGLGTLAVAYLLGKTRRPSVVLKIASAFFLLPVALHFMNSVGVLDLFR
jgi:hypothetical protein